MRKRGWLGLGAGVMLILAVLFFSSPCAWSVFAAPNAATCTCTWWQPRPCSGWSDYLNKWISCGLDGLDQDGRVCNGCCYEQVCATNTPLPAATATWTPSATVSPSGMATAMPTSTPTPPAPTASSSPTLTPLPPQVNAQVVCEAWGDAGWCRGAAELELAASDPQGEAVTITGDLGAMPFTCGQACSLDLPEGTGTANYTVTSSNGRTASGSSTWMRDVTPPELSLTVPVVDGQQGWYLSAADIAASANDAHSGVLSVLASVDAGHTWESLPLHLEHGLHPVVVQARDLAGNVNTMTVVLRVDTLPPRATLKQPAEGSLLRGAATLSGWVEDDTSGPAAGQFSFDEGRTWEPIPLAGEGSWSFQWDTRSVSNGVYSLLVRGIDQAGNLGESGQVGVVVDNFPPSVSLTGRWWIWETGTLRLSPNVFPIAKVRVKISDRQDRWPALILEYGPQSVPGVISWNRRFANGILAPSGEYRVDVEACDVYELCGHASAVIAIPVLATGTPTFTPTPRATATAAFTPSSTRTATAFPTEIPIKPVPGVTPAPGATPAALQREATQPFPWWQGLGLLGLMLALAVGSVIDPRPQAISQLMESVNMIANSKDLESNQVGN